MENEEIMLDEEVEYSESDIDADDIAEEDIEDDVSRESDAEDEEFEYDEEGNIIIPDVIEEEEGADTDADVADEEGETEQDGESEKEPPAPEVAEPQDTQGDTSELEELRRKLGAFESQAKDTLKRLGVKNENVIEGLASLAAEADGISTEEYLRAKSEQEKNEQARRLLAQQEFEKIAKADLAELQSAFPETKGYTDIRDMPKDVLAKFGRFRDMGLSAKEAYSAANPDGIRANVATAVKQQSLHDTKSHLRTAVPKGSKDNSVVMPRSELASWRDMFPNLSDREIASLYRKTAK